MYRLREKYLLAQKEQRKRNKQNKNKREKRNSYILAWFLVREASSFFQSTFLKALLPALQHTVDVRLAPPWKSRRHQMLC